MANYQRPQTQRQPLPQHAAERIARMRGGQGKARFFTSDLSVKEFLLVREAGFECAGLVMGSSIYHVGLQRGAYYQNQELGVLTQALSDYNQPPQHQRRMSPRLRSGARPHERHDRSR